MSTFAYEYYRRNRAVLLIGTKPEDHVRLIEIGKGKFTSGQPDIAKTIQCFYETAPQFTFSSGFNTEQSEAIAHGAKLYNISKAGINAIGKSIDAGVAGGVNSNAPNLGGQIADGFKAAGGAMLDALSEGYDISATPSVMRWTGQGTLEFTMKLIFLDKDGGPVYFDEQIQTLLSLVAFRDMEDTTVLDKSFSWVMRGPIGYHGRTSSMGDLSKFLDGTKEDLHSLILYKGGEETASKNTKILELHRILVIKSVKLQTSEQLYVKPSEKTNLINLSQREGTEDYTKNFPAYKWITAEVGFATVCPIPGPLSKRPTNLSNFYGLRIKQKDSFE